MVYVRASQFNAPAAGQPVNGTQQLQSLLALHGSEGAPSQRYISRMRQAVRILYGSASPSEAFQTSSLRVQPVDIAGFMQHVAENAGFDQVRCLGADAPVLVRADGYPLEDVFAHILKNADRYRTAGTPITLSLETSETTATAEATNWLMETWSCCAASRANVR